MWKQAAIRDRIVPFATADSFLGYATYEPHKCDTNIHFASIAVVVAVPKPNWPSMVKQRRGKLCILASECKLAQSAV